MPILDPVNFSGLLSNCDSTESKYSKQFFIRYLHIASRNLYRSTQTIEASIQFKKDLKLGFEVLNKLFGCNFVHENEFNDPTIRDYYRFLYEHIDPKYKTKILKKQKGVYNVFYEDFKIYFFQPYIDLHINRSWFLSNSPYAILLLVDSRRFDESVIQLSNFEIDLLTASGFSIVLCAHCKISKDRYNMIFDNMLSTHKFAEIHFYIDFDEDDDIKSIDDFFTKLLSLFSVCFR